MNSEGFPRSTRHIVLLALAGLLVCVRLAQAQTTISLIVPARGATGVSTATTVVFTFSAPMDPGASSAAFYNSTFTTLIPTSQSWSAGDTVLTCTPLTSFPANELINWFVTGDDANGDPLDGFGFASGTFTTGTGGGSSGSGTNAITNFSVGKVHHYNQTSAGSPTLDPISPYGFSGVTSLSSNRTATSVALTLPTGSVSNLIQLPLQPEMFIMSPFTTSLSAYDATFPAGDYSFFVQAAASNQTVVVNLTNAASMPQPGAPHLTNYPAAQAVNPNQSFVLGWDAFPGGTAADYIFVEIGTNNSYRSPNPGLPGALTGAARTFTIPAVTLQPDSTYPSRVGFYRRAGATNANYATDAYRATFTEFSLITTGSGQLVLTNASWTPSVFSFDVRCTNGQTVTVEYRTNLATGLWQTLLTTNSAGSLFHAIAPQAVTNRSMFFRARNGT